MARYRKIDPRVWDDEKFSQLDHVGKLIALYVITAQSNRIGLFRFSQGMALEHLRLDPETFPEGFGKVCRTLGWGFDEARRVVFIPTWWKYNTPENPNVLKACLQDLHEVPQSHLIARFAKTTRFIPETFLQTFRKGLPKPTPNQEQEQEQENKGSKDPLAAAAAAADRTGAEPAKAVGKSTPAADAGKPRAVRKAKPGPGGKPEHGEVRAYFCELWQSRRSADGSPYAWKHGRDDKHLSWVLDQCGRDPDKAKAIVRAFIDDDDAWLAEKGHDVALLVSRFNRYRARRPAPAEEPARYPTDAEVVALLERNRGRPAAATAAAYDPDGEPPEASSNGHP